MWMIWNLKVILVLNLVLNSDMKVIILRRQHFRFPEISETFRVKAPRGLHFGFTSFNWKKPLYPCSGNLCMLGTIIFFVHRNVIVLNNFCILIRNELQKRMDSLPLHSSVYKEKQRGPLVYFRVSWTLITYFQNVFHTLIVRLEWT